MDVCVAERELEGALQLAVVGASRRCSMTTAGCLESARAHPMGRGSAGNGSVPASRAGGPCSADPDDAVHNQALPCCHEAIACASLDDTSA